VTINEKPGRSRGSKKLLEKGSVKHKTISNETL
jgi:hypothetical protein